MFFVVYANEWQRIALVNECQSQYWSLSMYDISHAPFLWRSQCRFKREVQNDHHGDGCTAPPAPWSWRWRDCTMHTSREWHQWSLRWHSIAAKCIGDFLYRLWTSDSPEKRSIELRAEVRWVRRPPKRTQRPLRSACLRTYWNLTVTRSSAAPYATMRHPTEAKHSVCTACLSSLIWYVVDRSATLVWPFWHRFRQTFFLDCVPRNLKVFECFSRLVYKPFMPCFWLWTFPSYLKFVNDFLNLYFLAFFECKGSDV